MAILAMAGPVAVDGPPSLISTAGGDQSAEWIVEPDLLDSSQTAWCLPLLGIPLRIRRERVLDNLNRNVLFSLIQAHPGIHLRGLLRLTGFVFGTASYHLRVLEDHGFISAFRMGGRLCYFSFGVEPLEGVPLVSRRRVQILETIERFPGIGLNEIGAFVGLDPKTIAYHARALRSWGLVEADHDGRTLRLRYASPMAMAQR